MKTPIKIFHSGSMIEQNDFVFLKKIIENNFIGCGNNSQELIDYAKVYSGRKFAILCDSGTSALQIILNLLKVKNPASKKVLVSTYCCPSVASAILNEGLTPILIDVGLISMNLNSDIDCNVTSDALAIICSHMGGVPEDMDSLARYNVPLISDCAQALGTFYKNKNLLSLGQYSLTSFGPTKYITGGLGGILFCDEEKDFQHMKNYSTPDNSFEFYKEHGITKTLGQHPNDLNSGLILSQWKKLEVLKSRRRMIAGEYDSILNTKKNIKVLKEEQTTLNRFRYYFFAENATHVLEQLHEAGIDARSAFSHNLSLYQENIILPNVEVLSKKLISLPIYPSLSDEDVLVICKILKEL
jgi:dTDP-4-amino-4,6-dideoxygalactose transaminase